MLSPLYGQLSPLRVPTNLVQGPKTVSGLALWLDSTTGLYDATSGGNAVSSNGAAVARWEDQSGNLRHFTQATANNQPTLVASGLNGKATLGFDGTNDLLTLSSNSLLRNIPAYTCFFVRKTKTSVSALEIIFTILAGAPTIFDFNTQATNRPGLRARRDSANTLTSLQGSNSQTTAGTFELWGTLIDHSVTTATLFKNGTQLATNTAFLTSGNSQDSARTSSIGAFTTGTHPADLEIAEILIYEAALSTSARATIETYLNQKWAIY